MILNNRNGVFMEQEMIEKDYQEILLLVNKDNLTQLWNRDYLEDKIKGFLREEDAKGCFFMIDIDDFKYVNDNFGHMVGDSILVQFAEILTEFTGKEDIACRIGGDEFALFFRDLYQEEKIIDCLKHIMDNVQKRILCPDSNYRIHISIGVAKIPEDGKTFRKLYINADRALYHIKRNGKNTFHFYKKEMETISEIEQKKIITMEELKDSLKENTEKGGYSLSYEEFQIVYQFLSRNKQFINEMFCLLLFTLESEGTERIEQEEALEAMIQLERLIHQIISRGDISANYSSFQHLVLLSGVKKKAGDIIAEQLIQRYEEERKNSNIKLNYSNRSNIHL